MNRFHRIAYATILTGLVLGAGAVAASEIYKWTDESGTVHYGDRPSGADSEVRMQIASQPTDPARIQQIVDARREAEAQRDTQEAANAAAQPTEEDLRAAARERAEKCTTYKERMQKFLTSRRLYRQDENGERVYLSEQEVMAERARVQEKIVEFCGS